MILRCLYCDIYWEFDIEPTREKSCFTCAECKQDNFFRTINGETVYSDFGKKWAPRSKFYKNLKERKSKNDRNKF
jgi:hypothetical protein